MSKLDQGLWDAWVEACAQLKAMPTRVRPGQPVIKCLTREQAAEVIQRHADVLNCKPEEIQLGVPFLRPTTDEGVYVALQPLLHPEYGQIDELML